MNLPHLPADPEAAAEELAIDELLMTEAQESIDAEHDAPSEADIEEDELALDALEAEAKSAEVHVNYMYGPPNANRNDYFILRRPGH